MDEIKRRTAVILSFLEGKLTTGFIQTDVETVCLQMRKILELVALGSLVANKKEYSLQYEKFENHWHATRILEDIEAINPQFWPVPTEQVIDPSTGKVKTTIPVTDGFLTRDDLVSIYEQISAVLHAENPYRQKLDLERIRSEMGIWVTRIVNLLNHHQIQLVNPDLQIWVVMRGKDDDRVHTTLMERKLSAAPCSS